MINEYSPASCLTVGVSCGGWEGGFTVETGNAQSRENAQKNAARTHRQLHTVLGAIRLVASRVIVAALAKADLIPLDIYVARYAPISF